LLFFCPFALPPPCSAPSHNRGCPVAAGVCFTHPPPPPIFNVCQTGPPYDAIEWTRACLGSPTLLRHRWTASPACYGTPKRPMRL
jgi:hypothetical protein